MDSNLEQSYDVNGNASFNGESEKAEPLSVDALCILSEMYVKHHDVYHGSHFGASRGSSMTKKTLLSKMASKLAESGYGKRSLKQIDQRVKNSIKLAKQCIAKQKREASKTGGGKALLKIPRYIQIILDATDCLARFQGDAGGAEVSGSICWVEVPDAKPTPIFADNQEELVINDATVDGEERQESTRSDLSFFAGVTAAGCPSTSIKDYKTKDRNELPKKKEESVSKADLFNLDLTRIKHQIENEVEESRLNKLRLELVEKEALLLNKEMELVEAKIQNQRAQTEYWNRLRQVNMNPYEFF